MFNHAIIDLLLEHLRDLSEFLAVFLLIFSILGLIILYIHDRYQKEHSILRNYPIVGHLRYITEDLGVYLRQYWFEGDREELPFNRAQRSWVYRAAKDLNNTVSFGSTRDLKPTGTVLFVDAPFPTLNQDAVESKPVTIGKNCKHPYTAKSIFNISAMSYGAMSKKAIIALSHGAKMAGCWLNTGEGGVSPYHLEGGADLVAQIGTAKYGFRTLDGKLSDKRLREVAALRQIVMFEVKLSQGAKPGKGGLLPAVKVNAEISEIRGIPIHEDSISPNRHPEIANSSQLLDFINHVRDVTGKPTGFKIALGGFEWLDELCVEILKRGEDCAPDFITLDGAGGGTGAAPMSLIDYMGIPLSEALPVLVDTLVEYGLRDRIKIIASSKVITPADVSWALCAGADFINSARGFMFSLGCVQALRCHLNTCPTGITSNDPRYTYGLDPTVKSVRVYHYAKNMEYEIGVISHSCGVREPRQLNRSHARLMTANGVSISMASLYPNKIPGSKAKLILEKLRLESNKEST
ncbi:MAG: FMN-binding glutamate synthase family protein [Gammaproteobacteria bacterium]|nr:FMN-binding glutamate synthase family protein [Gammaproteobacteria bacterium]